MTGVDQAYLNWYFQNRWIQARPKRATYLEKILERCSGDVRVVDVGCGYNTFKGKIPNLVAFDPAQSHGDYRCTLEEFHEMFHEQDWEPFDIAICLGSLNFGTRDYVHSQITRVVSLLKPQAKIIWRGNMGYNDHPDPACEPIVFFPWSLAVHEEWSEEFGFDLQDVEYDDDPEDKILNKDGKPHRIAAVWTRSS